MASIETYRMYGNGWWWGSYYLFKPATGYR